MSDIVVATKWRLDQPISINQGTWSKTGPKTELETKVLTRAYVEQRNAQDNRELYTIDEEATKELLEKREENIIKKARKKKRESVGMADFADVLANAINGNKPEPKSDPDLLKAEKIDSLRAECDKLGIVYSKMAGIKKLTELINQFKAEQEEE